MQLAVCQHIFKCPHYRLSGSLYFNILPCLYEFRIQYTFIHCVAYELWFLVFSYMALSV
jgi:hypothetical protein